MTLFLRTTLTVREGDSLVILSKTVNFSVPVIWFHSPFPQSQALSESVMSDFLFRTPIFGFCENSLSPMKNPTSKSGLVGVLEPIRLTGYNNENKSRFFSRE